MDELDNQETGSNEPTIESIFYPNAEVNPELEESTELKQEETPTEVEEVKPETSEVEESNEAKEEAPEFTDDELVVDLNGREITVQQIKDWEAGNLKQKDYTQKTMALADEKRAWEADKQKSIDDYVTDKHSGLDDGIATLEALIKENDESIDWEDLRQYDPSEYLKQTEIKTKRQEAVNKAKELRNQTPAQVSQFDNPEFVAEQKKILTDSHPEWLNEKGEATPAFESDKKMLNSYLVDSGYTPEEQGQMLAKHFNTLLDAAKYRESQKKVADVKQQIKKLPITTKPKKGAVSSKTVEQLFYPNG